MKAFFRRNKQILIAIVCIIIAIAMVLGPMAMFFM